MQPLLSVIVMQRSLLTCHALNAYVWTSSELTTVMFHSWSRQTVVYKCSECMLPQRSPLSLCRTSQTCYLIVVDSAKFRLLAKLAHRRLCAGRLKTFGHFPLMIPIAIKFVDTCLEFVVSKAPVIMSQLCFEALLHGQSRHSNMHV